MHGFGGLGLNSVGVVSDLHCLVVWVGCEYLWVVVCIGCGLYSLLWVFLN